MYFFQHHFQRECFVATNPRPSCLLRVAVQDHDPHWAPENFVVSFEVSLRTPTPLPITLQIHNTPSATIQTGSCVPECTSSSGLTPGLAAVSHSLSWLFSSWRLWGRPQRGAPALHTGSSLCIHGRGNSISCPSPILMQTSGLNRHPERKGLRQREPDKETACSWSQTSSRLCWYSEKVRLYGQMGRCFPTNWIFDCVQ